MVFSLQILASGSIQIKKNHSECKVTFTVNKYLNLPAHFIGSNILMRHLGSLQDKSVVLCVQYYITYVGFIQTLRIHATITLFFFVVQQTNSVLRHLIPEFSVPHTIRHTHTPGSRTPLQG